MNLGKENEIEKREKENEIGEREKGKAIWRKEEHIYFALKSHFGTRKEIFHQFSL